MNKAPARVRSRRPALEGQRLGLVPHPEPVRAVEPLAGRGAGGRSARCGHARAPGPRLAAGEPVLDGAVEPDRGENVRPRHPGARLLRAEPGQDGAPARRLDRGLAAHPLPAELGRERANPPRPAEVRRRGPVRGRPPHRGLELVHAGSVGLDRQGHPALPRARKRLGRHRLQLPRRQVRPDLRRPVRRSRPERRRRACPGLQHGLVGDRADRDVRRQCAFAPPPAARWPASSPGGSTSRTSIRARRSAGARPATRAIRPAATSRCARSPATATRATRPVPEAGSTASCPRLLEPCPKPGCRSSTSRVATGAPGGFVHFTATLTEALPWSVVVSEPSGNVVAIGEGSGTDVDWTWDARTVPAGRYSYAIDAGPFVRPATGVVERHLHAGHADSACATRAHHSQRRRPHANRRWSATACARPHS